MPICENDFTWGITTHAKILNIKKYHYFIILANFRYNYAGMMIQTQEVMVFEKIK